MEEITQSKYEEDVSHLIDTFTRIEQKMDKNTLALEEILKHVLYLNENMLTKQELEKMASVIIEKQNKTMELVNDIFERQRARNARFYEEFKLDNRDTLGQNNS